MSALGIGPAVMVNRLVHREGDSTTPHLAKVAKLRMDLMVAADKEEAQQALFKPADEVEPTLIDSGAVVDRLV
ncbi:hypothetical protein [Devosia sp. Root635]|uniref:hypothetical protein n=1 Tax=Devosia sp. Root635 TaxID=1736575 RepID=UPI000AEC7881|nr:hypothetical protein [Devosia sp. Root635]